MDPYDYTGLPTEELDNFGVLGDKPTRQTVIHMINKARWLKSDRSKPEPEYNDPLTDF